MWHITICSVEFCHICSHKTEKMPFT